jgi:hypothetical protein
MELAVTKARKLAVLRAEKPREDGGRQPVEAFRNMSCQNFSVAELDLLSKGPNYAPPQRPSQRSLKLAEARIDCAMTKISQHTTPDALSEFSGAVKRILRQSAEESGSTRTVKDLKERDVIFSQTDKSKRLLALDPNAYRDLLNDHTENYKEARALLPSSVQAKFNSQLNGIAKKYREPLRETLCNLTCCEPLPSVMRALPKDHKEGVLKARPIVAAVDAPATKLSRFLAATFTPLLTSVQAHIPSSDDFLETLNTIVISQDDRFASLDVVDLFGSIPIEDNTFPGALTILTDFFEQHKVNTTLSDLQSEDFKSLLRLCLTSDSIRSCNKTYKQIAGIQMGNNFSCVCAIIFMNYIETEILRSLDSKIKVWKRYVDDVFLVYCDLSPTDLLTVCNDVHPNIVFTIEEPTNASLPYLDLLLTHAGDYFAYQLYAKPSHSGAVIPWSSHHPRSLLVNILKNEIKRATRNGSGPQQVEEGRNFITRRYRANGYPRRAIERAIFEVDNPRPTRRKKPSNFLTLPFVGERQAGDIKKLIRRCGLTDILAVSFKSLTLSSLLRPRRPSFCLVNNCKFCLISKNGEDCHCKFVVYFIECRLCSAAYVGETKRTMRSRLREHLASPTSHVFQHLTGTHARAEPGDLTWSILHAGVTRYDVRRRLEFYEIRSRNPLLNVQQSLLT